MWALFVPTCEVPGIQTNNCIVAEPLAGSHDLIAVATFALTPSAIVKVGDTHEIMFSVPGIRSIV